MLWLGSCRFPTSRRCTRVWSWPVSPLLARVLFYLKTAPGLPTATAKIAIGVAATGLAYVPLVVAAVRGSEGALVGLGWLFRMLGLLSVGELLIGALGPSFAAAAPPASGGRWLGAWYGATALGFWLAGRLGGGGTECRTRCVCSGFRWDGMAICVLALGAPTPDVR